MPMFALRESVGLLARYDLPALVGLLAESPEEAIEEVKRLAAPAAVKLISRSAPHKSRAGLVRLDVTGEEEAREAVAALRSAEDGWDDSEGVLVQPMIRSGVELFLGALVDEQFGPTVAFGPGGTLVEHLGGIDFLRPPFAPHHLLMFLERNAVYPILADAAPDAHSRVEAVGSLLTRLAALICDRREEISAVDMNPVVFAPGSCEPLILDLRVEGRIDHGRH